MSGCELGVWSEMGFRKEIAYLAFEDYLAFLSTELSPRPPGAYPQVSQCVLPRHRISIELPRTIWNVGQADLDLFLADHRE
jgi:hypothetical protein